MLNISGNILGFFQQKKTDFWENESKTFLHFSSTNAVAMKLRRTA